MATFEVVDGQWFKDYLWKFKVEEEIDYYKESSGLDSKFYMFTFGLPLYLFWVSTALSIILPVFHALIKLISDKCRKVRPLENTVA
jgi:hypothetical protein